MLTPVLLAQVESISLFVKIDHEIQRQLDALVIPAVNNLTGALQTTALLGGTLYILIVGLTIVLGADSTPFYTFLKTAGKIAIVAAFSLSSEGYLGGIVAALRGLESGLLQVFGLNPTASGPSGGLPFQLDQMLSIGFDKFVSCWERANQEGVLSPGAALAWVVAGLIFGLSTAVLAVFGGAITILVQFALAILFALGPLFVLCLMFPQTSGFFDKWLGEVLSFLLQNVVVAIVLSFALSIFLTFLSRAELGKNGPSPFIAAMQIFVVALVMVYFLWKSGPMVAGLSGGMGSSIVDAVSAYQAGKSVSGAGAKGAKQAASLPKQAVGAAKKMGGSKVASRLAHFGKSSSLGASSGASDKSSATSPSPSSSGAAKNAVASSPASTPTNTSSGPSRSGSHKERKAAKLGARALRSKAIGNFAMESAAKPRSVVSAQSAPKASISLEKSNGSSEPAAASNKPESNRS